MELLKLKWVLLFDFKKSIYSESKHHIKRLYSISVLILIANSLFSSVAFSQTNTWDGSSGDTFWNTASNWSLNHVPLVTEDVVIPDLNGNPVVIDANAVCASFTIDGGGRDQTVSINAGISLTVTSGVIIGAGSGNNDLKLLDVGAGSLSCASLTMDAGGWFQRGTMLTLSTGTVTVTGNISIGTGSFFGINEFEFTGAGTLNVGGNMDGGTFTAGTGTVNYNGSAQTVGAYAYNNLTFSGSGIKDMTGVSTIGRDFVLSGTAATTATTDLDINGLVTLGSGTSFTAGPYTHTVAGNWTNNGATFNGTNSTITLDGGAQTIGGSSSTSFNNLTLAGTGTKTFGLSTTISSNLSINTGVVADLGTFTTHAANGLSLGGVGQVAGTWGSSSSVAANQNDTYFAATAGYITTVSAGATTYYSRQTGNWNAATTWSTVTYGGAAASSFPMSGDIVNIGGGDFTITVNVNSICASLSFEEDANNSPTLSISAGITLDVSGTTNIPRTAVFSGDTNTLAVGDGTFNTASIYFGGGGFLGANELTIGTGTATITGDVATDGGFFFPTITFTGSGLLQVGGAFLDSSNGTLTPSTGTVEYNGTVAQTIGDFTYNNLLLSGSSSKDLSGVSTINGNLTMSGTASATGGTSITIGGDVTLGAGTTFTAGAYTHNVAGDWINNGATFNSTGSTITLNGAAQSIGGSSSTTFENLTLAGSGTKTFSLSTTTNATLSINSGVVANLSTITTHVAKTLTLNGAGQIPATWGSTASVATNQDDTYFTSAAIGILTVTNRIYYTRQTGNWNVSTSWSTVTYGNATNAGTFPTVGDIAKIGGAVTITVTSNAVCAFIDYESATGNTNIITINSGIILDVSDIVTIPRSNNPRINTMAVGAGALNAGSIAFTNGDAGNRQNHMLTISTGTVTISGTQDLSTGSATITFTGSGLLQLGGAFLNSTNCTFTTSTGTVEYNGSVAQTISDFTYYNLTLNNTYTTIPQLSLSTNTTVTNALTLTSGIVNLNG